MNRIVDSHCHLSLPRIEHIADQWIAEAQGLGIDFFMQAGIGPEDWLRQEVLAARYPGLIGLCFGLHPYWVADHSMDECEAALGILALHGKKLMALGEVGLDFREQFSHSQENQMQVMENQVELAVVMGKPLVLHVVQAHSEALKILDFFGPAPKGGLVHSFNGDLALAQEYVQRGFLISVGGPAARAKNTRLIKVLADLPLEHLLLESDAPDQPGDRYRGELNPPASIIDVAQAICAAKGVTIQEIFAKTSHNFSRVFGQ